MKLTRPVTAGLLALLFAGAIAARVSTTHRLDSPYFKGAPAMTYRHMMMQAEGTSLLSPDTRAGYPEGYVPARYRAAGVEVLGGIVYRIEHFFSEADGRDVARRLTVLMAALSALTAYAAARRLWECRAAGLLAAFLVALLPSLVTATNGRVPGHTVFAMFFAGLHGALALRALRVHTVAASAAAGAAALLLLAAWEPAAVWLCAWVVPAALSGPAGDRARRAFVLAHALAMVAGSLALPHLAATRAIGAWTTAAALAAVLVAFLPPRHRAAWRAAAVLAGAAAFVTLTMTPVRSGATEQFPALSYVLVRLRHLAGRPDAPELSEWMRHLWTLDHAPLSPYLAAQTFIPLALCAVALALNRALRARGARTWACAGVLLAAGLAAAMDRSALPVAAPALIVVVAGAARGLRAAVFTRGPWVAAAACVVLAGVLFRGSAADVALQTAKIGGGPAQGDPYGFVWVSLENTDRELVRFMSTRTSVRDVILAPDDLSALLVTSTGRAVAQLPGATSRAAAARRARLARVFYQDEAALYQLCREMDIDYVVYSIDVLLDGGDYSPRYVAGVTAMDPRSIAVRMHFEPESIEHFTLVYQNDHYRLFRVTEVAQPVFITDHPPFYHADVFARAGRNLEEFRSRVVYLMLSYAAALDDRAAGNGENARRRLAFCVEHAPRFTRARLALAEVLMDMNRHEEARAQIMAVIAYAPDNPQALYDGAWVEMQLGRPEPARAYLTLLLTQTGDTKMLERGRALQVYLEQKIPLPPGAPRP